MQLALHDVRRSGLSQKRALPSDDSVAFYNETPQHRNRTPHRRPKMGLPSGDVTVVHSPRSPSL